MNKYLVIVIMFVAAMLLGWIGQRTVAYIQFDRKCAGYLKRAADSNTVEMAVGELSIAVQYATRHKLTTGYTSVLWTTPDEDVGFWYSNLTASLKELRSVKPDAGQLEKTNVLMKLRETLLDSGEKGSTVITVPNGITVYPNNTLYFWWGWLSWLAATALSIGLFIKEML